MRIAVLKEPHELEIVEAPVPEPAADEALVRVVNCGVCASELDMWEGRYDGEYPRFLGHEVSGVVERVGRTVTGLRPGDPVAVWVTERGFADYVVAKAEYCLPADGLPLELALGEPVACAVNAVELAAPSLGDDVVIVGAGFMGNLVQKLVALRGCRHLVVADTRSDALDRAARIGATEVVNVAEHDLAAAVQELTGGRGADVTFEVTGMQGALESLGDVTRMSGKIAIVGYHQGGTRAVPLGHWNWMAFTIVNAHFRDVATIMRGMEVGMRLLTSGRLRLDDVVTHRYGLPEIGEAFEALHAKPDGFVKATVRMGDAT